MKLDLGDLTALPVIVGYALCSSLLAIINKYAITVFAFPSLLTFLQYVTSVVTVLTLGKLKVIEHDSIKLDTMWRFLPAAGVFYFAIFTNTNLLQVANIETFIVFRSSTPLLVAIADTVFRKQPIPSLNSFLSLSLILLGAVGYVLSDAQFSVRAYSWAMAYLITIVTEMVYIKHIVSNLGLNTWGFVLYTNTVSVILSPIFWLLTGEYANSLDGAQNHWISPHVFLPVAISCAFGVAISFFGYACRTAISATAFTVVGVTNKLLTIIINVLIWDKHASPFGLACLLLTIAGGVLYQQSVSKPITAPCLVDVEAGKPLIETSKFDAGTKQALHSPSKPEISRKLLPAPALISAQAAEGGAVAVAIGPELRLFDLKSRSPLKLTDETAPAYHSRAVRAVAFSPDGRWMASGGEDKLLKLWDAATWECCWTLKVSDKVTRLAFSGDSCRLVAADQTGVVSVGAVGRASQPFSNLVAPGGTSSRGLVRLWEPSSGKLLDTLQVSPEGVVDLAVAPGGITIAVAAARSTEVVILTCDVSNRSLSIQQRVDWGPESFPTALCFSPDSRLWVVGGEAETEEGQGLVSRALTLLMAPKAQAPPPVRVRVLGWRGRGEGREFEDGEKAGRGGEGGFEVVEGGDGSEGGDMLGFLQGS